MTRIKLLTITLLTLSPIFMFAQGGVHLFGGVTTVFSKDKNITVPKNNAIGYEIGIDAKLNPDDMYFLMGVKYGVVGDKELSYLKGRIGLGFDIFHLTHKIYFRTKLQGSLNYVVDYDEAQIGTDLINDGFAGLATGLGFTLGALMFDLDYEYGLYNIINKKPDTTLSSLSATVGVRF